MDKAMDEFMYSCVGYSVATYVLGVGDRHGDNIMLKQNGQVLALTAGNASLKPAHEKYRILVLIRFCVFKTVHATL